MQFTTIATLLAAALSASASPLEARQTSSTATGRFYNQNDGCNRGDTGTVYVFADDTNGNCVDVVTNPAVIPAIFATNFTQSAITPGRTLRLYNKPCGQQATANFIDITSADNNKTPFCKSLQLVSYQFGNF